MKKPAAIESTVEMPFGALFRIRVWRTESTLAIHYQNEDIIETIKQCVEEGVTPRDCIDRVASIERVAAVQLIKFSSQGYQTGVVLYTEWP
jgi:hypothetical protein